MTSWAGSSPCRRGAASPLEWGDEASVRARLGGSVTALRATPVTATLKFPFSVPETVEFFRTYFGPAQRAFAVLSAERQAVLRRDMEAVYERHNRAKDGTTHVEAEYLEVVATRA